MQQTANTETDRAFEVATEITHTVPWRVTSVTVLPDAQLQVSFVDGTSGIVDMRAFLCSAKVDEQYSSLFANQRISPKRELLWARSSGRAALTSRRMRCTMR